MENYIENSLSIGSLVNSVNPPQHSATFFIKAEFAIQAGLTATLTEDQSLICGDVYVNDDRKRNLCYPSDFAPFKPRADILLVGTAHAPGGESALSFDVRLRVGNMNKKLRVFGDRQWEIGTVTTHPSRPKSLLTLPLSYEYAYGGPQHEKNPLGKGHNEPFAPNIEDPTRPVRGSSDDIEPAGFGPVDSSWLQRMKLVGTYDAKWEETHWPWFPSDFDWGFFNAAPRDQQIEGYLRGDEVIEVENLHPEHRLYRTQLPALRARCFIEEKLEKQQPNFREVPMVLDTLWIDMDAECLILVWRGVIDIRSFKMKEVERVLAITESLTEPPKSSEHYREELNRCIAAQRIPEPTPPDPAAEAAFNKKFEEMEKQTAEMEARFSEAENEIEKNLAEAQQQFAVQSEAAIAVGFDPNLFIYPVPPAKPVDKAVMFDEMIAELDKLGAQLPAETANGEAVDVESMKEQLRSSKQECEQFDKEMEATRKEMEALKSELWTRQRVEQAITDGESFVEENLAEIDLSELDLSGKDFSGARLGKAILCQTKLVGARLTGADLRGANLSGADLSDAILDEANLSEAKLDGTCFKGTSLTYTTLMNLNLAGADFSSCTGEFANFSKSDLTDANFQNVQLTNPDFCVAKLNGAQFKGATVTDADFEAAIAPKINAQGSVFTGLRGSDGADFSGADFRDSQVSSANFDASILDRANFSQASLVGATFSDASAQNANFEATDLRNARFDDANIQQSVLRGANLLRCSFERADLTEADLEGSNLYESGCWDTKIKNARFRNANLKGTMLADLS